MGLGHHVPQADAVRQQRAQARLVGERHQLGAGDRHQVPELVGVLVNLTAIICLHIDGQVVLS